MANGLVQQDSRPARAQHDCHGAGRRRNRFQVIQRLGHRIVNIAGDNFIIEEVFVTETPAAAGAASFQSAVVLDDDIDIESHQRPDISGVSAVTAGNQYRGIRTAQSGDDLFYAGIFFSGFAINPLQQRNLLRGRYRFQRVRAGVQRGNILVLPGLQLLPAAAPGNCPRRPGRIGQGRQDYLIGIGESGLLLADRPDSNTLADAVGAFPDDAFFKHPCFGLGSLEIQVGVVDVINDHLVQGVFDVPAVNPRRVEQLPGRFLVCAFPGTHPAGVLWTSKFAPGEFVELLAHKISRGQI